MLLASRNLVTDQVMQLHYQKYINELKLRLIFFSAKQALQQVTVKRYLKTVKSRRRCSRHRFTWNNINDDYSTDDNTTGNTFEINSEENPKSNNYGPEATIFAQVSNQVMKIDFQTLRLPSQAWKVKLVGEGADDAGGVFDDTMSEMCKEVIDVKLNLLIKTPNAKDEVGLHR